MRTKIIAEIGANHNGDLAMAECMIRAAAEAGADIVKFQSWQARTLKPGDPNYERHLAAELSDEAHLRLIDVCRKNGVQFLTTCFDMGRIEFLASLRLSAVKIASPDCGSLRLIEGLRPHFEHLIISTGMTPASEVEKTAKLLKGSSFTFMHCVSMYPTPPENVNLARMDWLRQFTDSVGFSDHSFGTEAACIAVAKGATYIEKHFTLSRYLPGKDQAISCEPAELKVIADYTRTVERLSGVQTPELKDEELRLRSIYVGKWGNNRGQE